jgi:Cd2+/Zn2+-exporting ATPase
VPAREPDADADAGGGLFSPRGEVISASIAGGLLLVGWFGYAAAGIPAARWLVWISLGIGLVHGSRAAWESLRTFTFDIDCLMVVGAVLAAYLNAPAEGALLLFLFVLAGGLEGLAMARTKRAVEALHKLMPTATLRADERGEWVLVPPESLAPGDRVKIPPGEVIPADAELLVGLSSVNQATLTGESMPRDVRPGDEVYAGTLNVGNPIEVRVLRPAAESSLQRIVNLVTHAQEQREPVQRFIDKVSEPYALSVLGVSVFVWLVWWLGFGDPVGEAAYTAITLLIVMSPCAVIIATPTATLAGIARAARGGVLFKGGQAMERLSRLGALCLDKTGTLTIGRPDVQQVHPVGWSDGNQLLAIAAGLEQDSTHPIAAAIVAEAKVRGVTFEPAARSTFTPGRGVSGVFGAVPARLGTFEHAEELIPVCLRARAREVLGRVQARGQIGVIIAWNGQAAVIVMSDALRPGADELAAGLHEIGVRPLVILSGDKPGVVERLAKSLGIDRFHAELLPEQKVDHVAALRSEIRHRRRAHGVGLIGDGVNDAPALAAADVAIAVGSIGSDAALESADIVMLGDDLRSIPWSIRLARRTRWTIVANLTFALAAIAIMAIITLVGSRTGDPLPLWAGVLGHEGGTLLVVANSLLLLAVRPWAKRSR